MPIKKFHSRRSYRRIILWGGICLFLTLLGLLAMDLTGSTVLLFVVGGMLVLGLVLLVTHGRKDLVAYELEADTLLLRRGAEEERLPLKDVIDANLIDLVSARDYIQQQGASEVGPGHGRVFAFNSPSTRYCGVPIAAGRLGSIMAGFSDLSAHSFRESLVLLRIRDGGVLLLSPRYSERMVRAIGKAKRAASSTSGSAR